jgi:periplasmic divalent cation tolerance protein
MKQNKGIMVYITVKNRREALKIARILVEQRLVACVNILGPIDSLYWWGGKICSDKEVTLIAKTTRRNFAKLLPVVKDAHSYQVPCVVALPMVEGNPDFLAWIEKETRTQLFRRAKVR